VKPQGPGPNNDQFGSAIVEKAIDSTHSSVFLSWSFSTSKFRFGGGHINTFITSTGTFPPSKFYHVVGTYNGTTFELFVNKVSQGTFTPSTSSISYISSIPWTIGTEPLPWRTGTFKRTWNGVIDEVAIFDRALSQSEINLLHDVGSAGKCKPSAAKGMTWRWGGVNATSGTVIVGCGPSDPVHPCNASVGDQLCTDSLPLLCFKPFNPLLPTPKSVVETPYYYQWSGGIVATTPPVQASSFNGSLALANARCEQEFGPTVGLPKWRVAEFHDGGRGVRAAGGWNFHAYGNMGDPKTRFWVHIDDQPKGTCFTKP
jgi:concanavalin A-like lectin/glucanase superfamily protein